MSKPTNEHVWLTDGNSSIVSLWFDRDFMLKVLLGDDERSDSEESDDDYENDFAINEKIFVNLIKIGVVTLYAAYSMLLR